MDPTAVTLLTPILRNDGWQYGHVAAACEWLHTQGWLGQRIAVNVGPSLAAAELLQAAWHCGTTVVLLPRRWPERDQHAWAQRTQVVARVSDPLPAWNMSGSPVFSALQVNPATTALVLATSGTDSPPKAVRLSRRALVAATSAACERLHLHHGDTWSCCLPLDHIGGVSTVLRGMRCGYRLRLHARFDAAAIADDLTDPQLGVTGISLVPTMLHRVLDAVGSRSPSPLLRVLLIGGAPLSAELARRCRAWGVTPCATYGLSECASMACVPAPGTDAAAAQQTVGTAVPGLELRVTDDGTIQLRGDQLFDGYEQDDGSVLDARTADGWFATSDMGSLDEHGRLTVLGRRDDVIISGGEKIAPAPIEAVLEQIPGIREAAVIGVADPDWGQRVTAVLVADASVPDDRTIALALEQLPSHQRPKSWCWIERLPRTALGKLQRRAISRELRKQEDARDR